MALSERVPDKGRARGGVTVRELSNIECGNTDSAIFVGEVSAALRTKEILG